MAASSGLKEGFEYSENSNATQGLLNSAGMATELAFGEPAFSDMADDGLIRDLGFEFPKPPWPDFQRSGISDEGLLPSGLEVSFVPDDGVLIEEEQDLKIPYPLGLSEAVYSAPMEELKQGLPTQVSEKATNLAALDRKDDAEDPEAEMYNRAENDCLSKDVFPAATAEEKSLAKQVDEKEPRFGLSMCKAGVRGMETEAHDVTESKHLFSALFPTAIEEERDLAKQVSEKTTNLAVIDQKDDTEDPEAEMYNRAGSDCLPKDFFPAATEEDKSLAKQVDEKQPSFGLSMYKAGRQGMETEPHDVTESKHLLSALFPTAIEEERGLAKQVSEKATNLAGSDQKDDTEDPEAEMYNKAESDLFSKDVFPAATEEEKSLAKQVDEKEPHFGFSMCKAGMQGMETEAHDGTESQHLVSALFPTAIEEERDIAIQATKKESNLCIQNLMKDIEGSNTVNVTETECHFEAVFSAAMEEERDVEKQVIEKDWSLSISISKEDVDGFQTETHDLLESKHLSEAVSPEAVEEECYLAKQVTEKGPSSSCLKCKKEMEDFMTETHNVAEDGCLSEAIFYAAIEEERVVAKQVTEDSNLEEDGEGSEIEPNCEGESKGGLQTPRLQVPETSGFFNCSETALGDGGDIGQDLKMDTSLVTGRNAIKSSDITASGMGFRLALDETLVAEDGESKVKRLVENVNESAEQFTRKSISTLDRRELVLHCWKPAVGSRKTPEEVFLSHDTLTEGKLVELENSNAPKANNSASKKVVAVDTEGGGFKVGDLVWAKVKSHPWWPGQIFDSIHASPAAKRIQKSGRYLVAFFGDCTFGWLQESQLIAFQPNFTEKVKQTTMKSFCKAVSEALDEVCRQAEVGWCHSGHGRKLYSTSTFPDENAGIQSGVRLEIHTDICSDSEKFNPVSLFEYLRSVACLPLSGWNCTVKDAESRGQLYAFRNGIFGLSKLAYQENPCQDQAGGNRLLKLQSDALLEKACIESLPTDVCKTVGSIPEKARKSNADLLGYGSETDSAVRKPTDDYSRETLTLLVDSKIQIDKELQNACCVEEDKSNKHERRVKSKGMSSSQKPKGIKKAKELHISEADLSTVDFSQCKEVEVGNNSVEAGETLFALAGYNTKLVELKDHRKAEAHDMQEISGATMGYSQQVKIDVTKSDDTEETLLALAGYEFKLKERKTIKKGKEHTKSDGVAMESSHKEQLQSGNSDDGGETLLALGGFKPKLLKKHRIKHAAEDDKRHDVKKQKELSTLLQSETQQENVMPRKRKSIDGIDKDILDVSEYKMQSKADAKNINHAMQEHIMPVNASTSKELDKASIERNYIPIVMNATKGDHGFLPKELNTTSAVEAFVSSLESKSSHSENSRKEEAREDNAKEQHKKPPEEETLLEILEKKGAPARKRKSIERMNKDVAATSGFRIERKTETSTIVAQSIKTIKQQQSDLVEVVTTIAAREEANVKEQHEKPSKEETLLKSQQKMNKDVTAVSELKVERKRDASKSTHLIEPAMEPQSELVEIVTNLASKEGNMAEQHEKTPEEETFLESQENVAPARKTESVETMNKDVTSVLVFGIERKTNTSTIVTPLIRPVVQQQNDLVEVVTIVAAREESNVMEQCEKPPEVEKLFESENMNKDVTTVSGLEIESKRDTSTDVIELIKPAIEQQNELPEVATTVAAREGNVKEQHEKPQEEETLLESQENDGAPKKKRKSVETMNKNVIAVCEIENKTDTLTIVTQSIKSVMEQQSELVESVITAATREASLKQHPEKLPEEEMLLASQENNVAPARKRKSLKTMTKDVTPLSEYKIEMQTDTSISGARPIKPAMDQRSDSVEVVNTTIQELDLTVREMEQQHKQQPDKETSLKSQENNGAPARKRKSQKKLNKDVALLSGSKIERKRNPSTIIAQLAKPALEQQIGLVEPVNTISTQEPDAASVNPDSLSKELKEILIAKPYNSSMELDTVHVQNTDKVVDDTNILHQKSHEEKLCAALGSKQEETEILGGKNMERVHEVVLDKSEKIKNEKEVLSMEQQSKSASHPSSPREVNKSVELNALPCGDIDKEKGKSKSDTMKHQKLLEKEIYPGIKNSKQKKNKRAGRKRSLDLRDSPESDSQNKTDPLSLKAGRIMPDSEQISNLTDDVKSSTLKQLKKETFDILTTSKEPNMSIKDHLRVSDKGVLCLHGLQQSDNTEKTLKTSKKGKLKVGSLTGTSTSQSLDKALQKKTVTESSSLLAGRKVTSANDTTKESKSKSPLKKKTNFMKLLHKLSNVAKDPLNCEIAVDSSVLVAVFLKFRDIVFQKSAGYAASTSNDHQNLVEKANVINVRTSTSMAVADVKNISLSSGHVDAVPADGHDGLQAVNPKEHKRKLEIQIDSFAKRHEKGGKLTSPISISSRLQTIKDEPNIGKQRGQVGVNNGSRHFENQMSPVFRSKIPREVEMRHFGSATSDTFSRKPGELPDNRLPSVAPTALFMKFPESFALPSEVQLNATFIRYGSLDVAATRVYRSSGTAQIVFKHSHAAEAAFRFAKENGILGQAHVAVSLRHSPQQKMSMQNASNSGKDICTTSVNGKVALSLPLKEETRDVSKERLHSHSLSNRDNSKFKPMEVPSSSTLLQSSQRPATAVGHSQTMLASSMSESAARDSSGDMKDQMIKLLKQVSFIVGSSNSVGDQS